MNDVYLILIGLVGGFLAGMLGVGGGIIYIVVLPLILEQKGLCEAYLVPTVVANSILASFIASGAANIRKIINGTFDYRQVLLLGTGGIVSSILVMTTVVESTFYSKTVFNAVVILLLIFMTIRLFAKREDSKFERPVENGKLLIVGGLAGAVAALSGLGGGVIIVPALALLFEMDIKKAKNISLGVIGFMALFFSLRNVFAPFGCQTLPGQFGLLVLPLTLMIGLGVVVGAPLGVYISKIVSGKIIKVIFAVMLGIVIARKVFEIYQSVS